MWVEITTKCIVGVALQSLEALPAGEFPDLESLVVTGGNQQPGVRTPGHVRDPELVARDRLLELPVVGAPHLDQLVRPTAGQPLPVGGELDAGDGLGVARQGELQHVVRLQVRAGLGGATAGAGVHHWGRAQI